MDQLMAVWWSLDHDENVVEVPVEMWAYLENLMGMFGDLTVGGLCAYATNITEKQ